MSVKGDNRPQGVRTTAVDENNVTGSRSAVSRKTEFASTASAATTATGGEQDCSSSVNRFSSDAGTTAGRDYSRHSTTTSREEDSNEDAFSSASSSAKTTTAEEQAQVWRIFCVFSFYYGVAGSYDLGAVTATLSDILQDLHVDNLTLAGVLGSVGYYGMFMTMPFFGVIFSKMQARQGKLRLSLHAAYRRATTTTSSSAVSPHGGATATTLTAPLLEISQQANKNNPKNNASASKSSRSEPELDIIAWSFLDSVVARGQWLFFILDWTLLGLAVLLPMCLATDIRMMLVGRFLLGTFQGAVDVYYPVWIEERAPPCSRTVWQASRFVCILCGVILGYIVGGALVSSSSKQVESGGSTTATMTHDEKFHYTWRLALAVEGIASFVAAALLFILVDPAVMRLRGEENNPATGAQPLEAEVVASSPNPAGPAGISGNARIRIDSTTTKRGGNGQAYESLGIGVQSTATEVGGAGPPVGVVASASRPFATASEDKTRVDHERTTVITAATIAEAKDQDQQDKDSGTASDVDYTVRDFTVMESLRVLATNLNYAIPVLNLSCVFLVAQGVQFWSPQYLRLVFHPISEGVIVGSTIVLLLTGPAAGIFLGGKFIDMCGGYHGRAGRIRTYKILLGFSFLSTIAGTVGNWMHGEAEYAPAACFLWIVFAVGAASVGPLQGIAISAIPYPELRTFGNSLATVSFMVGASIGPLIPGFLLQSLCPPEGAVKNINMGQSTAPGRRAGVEDLVAVQTAAGVETIQPRVFTSSFGEDGTTSVNQSQIAHLSELQPTSGGTTSLHPLITTLCAQESVAPLLCSGYFFLFTTGLCLWHEVSRPKHAKVKTSKEVDL
ncbi:unnamed protein product [Amoebophrya sp. A120]|nr:unnamed protein product [Amoebophrya sp. A120]|eukprot:GSA120T00001414001.1